MTNPNQNSSIPTLPSYKILRPSAFPALEECLHYQSRPYADKYATRGLDWHREISAFLSGKISKDELDQKADLIRTRIDWIWREFHARRIDLTTIETDLRVPIYDKLGELICHGSCDAVALSKSPLELILVDFKSGEERNYSAQFCGYGKGLMDVRGYKRCVVMVFYLDSGKVIEYDLSYEEASERVFSLYDRWLERENVPPRINEHCSFCALRGTCSAWLERADQALSVVPNWDNVVFAIELLKEDPVKLGAFLSALKALNKIEEEHKLRSEVVFNYLQNGIKVPGFGLSRNHTSDTIDSEQVLAQILPMLGPQALARCASFSAPELQAEWKLAFPDTPFPVAIAEGREYYFARSLPGKSRKNELKEKGPQ